MLRKLTLLCRNPSQRLYKLILIAFESNKKHQVQFLALSILG